VNGGGNRDAMLETLSDGLERLMPIEGANIAPD
jgi:hypothetical protein